MSTIKSMIEDAAQQRKDLLDDEESDNPTDEENQVQQLMQKDIEGLIDV